MSWTTHLKNRTFKAGFDASTVPLQYAPVDFDPANALQVLLAATGKGVGILQNHPKSGEAATVAIQGQTRAIAGAAVSTPGVFLTANASGCVTAVGSGAAGGIVILGRAISTAASGSLLTMELNPFLFSNSGGAI